jgi:hypothetical protein
VLAALQLEGPRHTLFTPRLNHVAVKAFFRAGRAELPFSGFGQALGSGRRNSAAAGWQRRHGKFTHEQRRLRLAEACQHRANLCAALFVEALAEAPLDPGLHELLAQTAANRERFGAAIEPEIVLALAALTRGDAARMSPEQAARAMRGFVLYHAHGVAGPGRRLVEMWRHCRADDPGTCEAGREMATALLDTGAGAAALATTR